MLNLNVFEALNCFFSCKKGSSNDDIDHKIYDAMTQHNISVLPTNQNNELDNLFPVNSVVDLWNIFVIGSDKTYIMVKVGDPDINIPHAAKLLNHQANNIVPNSLIHVFDMIWDKTLAGKQLEFCMVWNEKLYNVNTYPFYNGKNAVVGAIMFLRKYQPGTHQVFTTLDGVQVPVRGGSSNDKDKISSKDRLSNPSGKFFQHSSSTNELTEAYISAKVHEYLALEKAQINSTQFLYPSKLYKEGEMSERHIGDL